MIIVIIGILLGIIIVLIFIASRRYYLDGHIHELYMKTFRHPPDEISLDRWMYNWKGDAVFYDFYHGVEESVRLAKNEKIIFTGLCQDNGEEIIQYWVPIVEYIGSHFDDYRILIMENDSSDDTRERWLQETYRNPRILLLCDDDQPLNTKTCDLGIRSFEGDKEKSLKMRVDRMAVLRDLYLRRIGRKWSNYEFMVVMDWDLIGDLVWEGFFHALSYVRQGKADVMAVNSLYRKNDKIWRIFDTFPLLNHHRCEELHKKKRQLDADTESAWRERLTKTLNEPVQIESAFGGMAIYSLQTVLETKSHYDIPNHEKRCSIQCEHTSFHRYLRVFIDPWFILLLKKNLH